MSDSSMEDKYRQEYARLTEAERLARGTRGAAGMGFWRLVLIVAIGIVMGNAAWALVVWLALWFHASIASAS